MSQQDEEDIKRDSNGGDDEEEPEGEREAEGGEGEGEIGEDDVTVGALRWAPGKIRPGKKGLKKGKNIFSINKRSKLLSYSILPIHYNDTKAFHCLPVSTGHYALTALIEILLAYTIRLLFSPSLLLTFLDF